MPKTIIIRQTWHCTGCGYEADRLIGACRTVGCSGTMYLESNPAKCGSMTVIGPEDVEDEIAAVNSGRASRAQPALSATAENQYRTQRIAEMNAAIVAIKLREHRV